MFEVIKSANAFAVFEDGSPFQICPKGDKVASGYGFYHEDTRFIRQMNIRLRDSQGEKLTSSVTSRGRSPTGERWWIMTSPAGDIEHRTFIYDDVFHHSFKMVRQADGAPLPSISVEITPSFEDIFEVRDCLKAWERTLIPYATPVSLSLAHEGQDGQTRFMKVDFPEVVSSCVYDGQKITFDLPAKGRSETGFSISVGRNAPPPGPQFKSYDECLGSLENSYTEFSKRFSLPAGMPARMESWVAQAKIDMFQLQGKADGRSCTHAGIPWFGALFGRDSIIASEQALSIAPTLARDTLYALGLFQAQLEDARFDAQPGKLPHEIRFGERCRLGHIPFGRYYGSVDSTPLYVSLMRRYVDFTRDLTLLNDLKPVLHAAIGWLERELEKGKFLTYSSNQAEEGPHGLIVKGWKDGAPVFGADGKDAVNPVALCEVQGYAYYALLSAASLLERFPENYTMEVQRLLERAERLKSDFNKDFWMEDLQTFAMSIDGSGFVCDLETSNPAHLLRTGIVDDQNRILGIVKSLINPDKLFSGWGVRTLSANSRLFNPASYQLGGVWPAPDTCEALRGLLHVGAIDAAQVIFRGLIDLAAACDYRLPELITGHDRKGDSFSIYANACSPQAWSASIPFSLIPHLAQLDAK